MSRPAKTQQLPERHSGLLRRVGAVLAADPTATTVKLWVNGITPPDGVLLSRPAGLPKWMARTGATFDVWNLDTLEELPEAVFSKQPTDTAPPYPPDAASEAERLRTSLSVDAWHRFRTVMRDIPEDLLTGWNSCLQAATRPAAASSGKR